MKIRLNALPLPVSAIAMLSALALGVLEYQTSGWVLFGIGVLAWIKLDGPELLKSDRYGLPPVMALLAYAVLAGSAANFAVTSALALHALVVFLILLSRHLSQDTAQAFSQQKEVSARI